MDEIPSRKISTDFLNKHLVRTTPMSKLTECYSISSHYFISSLARNLMMMMGGFASNCICFVCMDKSIDLWILLEKQADDTTLLITRVAAKLLFIP